MTPAMPTFRDCTRSQVLVIEGPSYRNNQHEREVAQAAAERQKSKPRPKPKPA
jgi:hypothetical protein